MSESLPPANPAPEPILAKRPLLRKLLEVLVAAALAYLGVRGTADTNPAPVNVQIVGPSGEPLTMTVSSPK